MRQEQSKFEQQAVEAVRHLWHTYLITRNKEELSHVFEGLAENMVLIGTGKDEFYESKEVVEFSVSSEQEAENDIVFDILDEWYRVQHITDDVCMVYGILWARERPKAGQVIVADMDTRFSIVCRKHQNVVEICNMHHSMPSIDQQEGEFYPKSITEMANVALERSKLLENRLQRDPLTGLYNRSHAENYVNHQLIVNSGGHFTFVMLDIDDFKLINDQAGHLEGDRILQFFSKICADTFADSFAARLGGDEFMIFLPVSSEKPVVTDGVQNIIETFQRYCSCNAKLPSIACSVGIAGSPENGTDFNTLYHNADKALYRAKRQGKGCFQNYSK